MIYFIWIRKKERKKKNKRERKLSRFNAVNSDYPTTAFPAVAVWTRRRRHSDQTGSVKPRRCCDIIVSPQDALTSTKDTGSIKLLCLLCEVMTHACVIFFFPPCDHSHYDQKPIHIKFHPWGFFFPPHRIDGAQKTFASRFFFFFFSSTEREIRRFW